MPSWESEGCFGDGAASCSYLTWNGGAGSMGMLFVTTWYPLRWCSEVSTVLHLSSLLFDSPGIPLWLLGGSNTSITSPQRQRYVVFLV